MHTLTIYDFSFFKRYAFISRQNKLSNRTKKEEAFHDRKKIDNPLPFSRAMTATWHAWQFILPRYNRVCYFVLFFLSVINYLIEEKMPFTVSTSRWKLVKSRRHGCGHKILNIRNRKFNCFVICGE